MLRARNLCLRFGLVLVILFSSTLSSSVLTPAQELQQGPSGDDPSLSGATISVQGDINVLGAELQNVRVEQGLPVGEVVLRNQHPLWYIVSQSGLAISGSKLQSWVILPPCRAKIRLIPPGTDYDCTKSVASLGRMPLRNGEEVMLFADGVGVDALAQKKLAMIYGAEVFWRLVLKDDLPLDVGTALSDVAFKVADWDLQALGKNLPIFTFYKIGKAFSDNDPLQMVSEINGALSDSAFRGFLETQLGLSKGALPSGLATIDIALRIEKVLELPLIFGIEGVTSVGKPFGTVRLVPFVPGRKAPPTSSSNAKNIIAYRDLKGVLVTHNLDDGSVNTVPPPEPGIKDFVISADLSTYAWVTDVLPRVVKAKVLGQPSKPITTVKEIWPEYSGWSLSLSDDGSLISIGPLGAGADGWRGGQLIFNTRDGTLITSCEGFTGRFSPDRTLLAELSNIRGPKGPGVTDQHPGICDVSGTNGGTAQALQAVINSAMSDWKEGSSTYWVASPPTWREDGQAIVYGQRRRQTLESSQVRTTDHVVMATTAGTQVILESPAASAAEMVVSPDGRHIVFGQFENPRAFLPAERGPESLWLIGIDGSGLSKIAEGTSPSWVIPQSPFPTPIPTAAPTTTSTPTSPTPTATSTPLPSTATPITVRPQPWIAYVGSDQRSIWAIQPDGTQNKRLLHSGQDIRDLAWSPDGQRLAYYIADGGLHILNFSTGQTNRRATYSPILRPIAFFPDGRRMLAISGKPEDTGFCADQLVAIDLTSGQDSNLLRAGCRVSSLQVTSNGQSLVVTSGGSDPTSIVQLVPLLPVAAGPLPVCGQGNVGLAPCVRSDGGVSGTFLTNPNTGGPLRALYGTLSANSTLLAYTRDPSYDAPFPQTSPLQVIIANVDGSSPRVINQAPRAGNASGVSLSFSPDGSRLTLGYPNNQIWLIATDGSNLRKIADGFYPLWQPGSVFSTITRP